jgi:hypothetical protein
MRARFGMDGIPLIIDFNERKARRSEIRDNDRTSRRGEAR